MSISINVKPISVAKSLLKDYNFDDVNSDSLVNEFC
jgi:hypothetical protein